jgi:DNA-binding CsgD family transcriptional regulator
MINLLTPRERELLADVSDGLMNKEIALCRHISLGTVKNHLVAISGKLGLRNRVEMALHVQSGELDGLRRWQEREVSRRGEYDRAQHDRIKAIRDLRLQVGYLQTENDRLRASQ